MKIFKNRFRRVRLISKRARYIGVHKMLYECLRYIVRYKNMRYMWRDAEIKKMKKLNLIISYYTIACWYYYDCPTDILLRFVPCHFFFYVFREFYFPNDQVKDLYLDKILFAQKMRDNNVPCVPVLYWKDKNGQEWGETNGIIYDVIEKPIRGIQGGGVSKYSEFNVKDAKPGYLYQKRIENHGSIQSFAGNYALNTVRVLTYVRKDATIEIVSAVFKMSMQGIVDYYGIGIGVDIADGSLFDFAKDMRNGNRFVSHPVTGAVFRGTILPLWSEVLGVVTQAAHVMKEVRLIGWDVAITDRGAFLLEGNINPEIRLSQFAGTVFYNTALVQENLA